MTKQEILGATIALTLMPCIVGVWVVYSWRSKESKTFKETFEHFGVDTSEMVISLV